MARPKIKEKTLKKRIEWKKLVGTILQRGLSRPTSSEIANTMNEFLRAWDQAKLIDERNVRQYITLQGKETGIDRISDIRIPSGVYKTNAFVYALENLGVWNNVETEVKHVEQDTLISLLGYRHIEPPKLEERMTSVPIVRFGSIEEARECAGRIIYLTIKKELDRIYETHLGKDRDKFLGDLEEVIKVYSHQMSLEK